MPVEQAPAPASHDHYSFVTRRAIKLYREGCLPNVQSLLVEPEYGYTTRLTYDDGSHRITYGNDLGLNPGAANDLAKDKGHTKFLLRSLGVNTPKGAEFLLPHWAERIRDSQRRRGNPKLRTTSDAPAYIQAHLGYPVYIKPVSGSKGLGVTSVQKETEAEAIFEQMDRDRSRVAVVEAAVEMPDYRLVMLDGVLISAYLRKPLTIVGDGKSPVIGLLTSLQTAYQREGRDTRIDRYDPRILQMLGRIGYSMATVPAKNQEVVLLPVSNLSAGGTSEDVTAYIHPRWTKLAAFIAANFNLRLCGIDLACEGIRDPKADYSILEVNATPGLDHYAYSGEAQQARVDQLYAKVLNAYPHSS